MASGCIVGECYLCKMPVYEDEARWNDNINKFKHSYCKTNQELRYENELLRKELEPYHKWLKGHI
jgi:hypothetical protein